MWSEDGTPTCLSANVTNCFWLTAKNSAHRKKPRMPAEMPQDAALAQRGVTLDWAEDQMVLLTVGDSRLRKRCGMCHYCLTLHALRRCYSYLYSCPKHRHERSVAMLVLTVIFSHTGHVGLCTVWAWTRRRQALTKANSKHLMSGQVEAL